VKRYRTLCVDPPWPFRWSGGVGGAHRNPTPMAYRLMTLDEIKALPVADMAEDDAHLFMWVTPELHRLGEGVATARAWGFDPVDEIIWEKPNIGMGVFPRHVHEPLLICRRGDLPFTGPRNVRSSPGPYLELFARRARFGWDYWGDQSLGTAEMDAA
jgi:N6-adenosine-specific RNA methylase IME4